MSTYETIIMRKKTYRLALSVLIEDLAVLELADVANPDKVASLSGRTGTDLVVLNYKTTAQRLGLTIDLALGLLCLFSLLLLLRLLFLRLLFLRLILGLLSLLFLLSSCWNRFTVLSLLLLLLFLLGLGCSLCSVFLAGALLRGWLL